MKPHASNAPQATDSAKIAEQVRSGEYYKHGLGWYQSLYIGPISERSFFTILAGLAGIVAIAAIIAVFQILPIVDRSGILVRNDRISEVALNLRHIRSSGQTSNEGMLHFFIKQYVFMRESYDRGNYARDYMFVRAHSDDATFAGYAQSFDPSNSQSPLVTLGEFGQKVADIRWLEINDDADPATAIVRFSTEAVVSGNSTITQWTATLRFHYTPFVETPVKDPKTGIESHSQIQEPAFKVVSYAVSPASSTE